MWHFSRPLFVNLGGMGGYCRETDEMDLGVIVRFAIDFSGLAGTAYRCLLI